MNEIMECAVCMSYAGRDNNINLAETMVCGTYVCYLIEHINVAIEWANGR